MSFSPSRTLQPPARLPFFLSFFALLFFFTSGSDCRERMSWASSTPGKCSERTWKGKSGFVFGY